MQADPLQSKTVQDQNHSMEACKVQQGMMYTHFMLADADATDRNEIFCMCFAELTKPEIEIDT